MTADSLLLNRRTPARVATLGGSAELPTELVGRAVAHVRVLCMTLGAIALIYVVVTALVQLGILDTSIFLEARDLRVWMTWFYVIAGAAMLLAAATFAATYWRTLAADRIMTLGLILQVLGALCIGTAETLATPPPLNYGISWVCVWILSFSLVPMTARRAAVASLLAATMGPLGLAINATFNHGAWPRLQWMVLQFIPNYVAAAIAVLTARMVHRLGTDVSRARRLGSYRLVERLGQGGMGEVWSAEHESLIRPAAVKLIRSDVSAGLGASEADALLRRFRREVQATSLLQSPHTVAVYDFGQNREGTMYYVMELLRGIDLERLVRRFGPQPAERVVHLLLQACHSLADAHRHGLVHRDIKPANLHLCVLGQEFDFVKVLDFGLVRDAARAVDIRITVAGSVMGTPAYMAPEMAVDGHADARSDLYSLGCVAYWLLTGAMVFSADKAFSMMSAHASDLPDPPSQRTELPIPPELEAIVLSLLHKNPDARPQSAAELALRLEAVPLASRWSQPRAEQWWHTHMPQVLQEAATLRAEVALQG